MILFHEFCVVFLCKKKNKCQQPFLIMNLFMANHNDHHGINDKNNSIDVNEFIGHNSDVPFSPSLSSTTFISFSLFDLTTTLTALFYGE